MKIRKIKPTVTLVVASSCLLLLTTSYKNVEENYIPIWFEEYGVEILSVPRLGDTISYNKSSKEDFKFVFFDNKGKCYCEHYISGKLYEKGKFENSLDTLKRYVSTRLPHGVSSPITVQKYFQPLRDGEWLIYKKGKLDKTLNYDMGHITVAL